MKKSHWITTESGEHALLTFAKRTPISVQDELLAQKIGELDPFVKADEQNETMMACQVQWVLSWSKKRGVA